MADAIKYVKLRYYNHNQRKIVDIHSFECSSEDRGAIVYNYGFIRRGLAVPDVHVLPNFQRKIFPCWGDGVKDVNEDLIRLVKSGYVERDDLAQQTTFDTVDNLRRCLSPFIASALGPNVLSHLFPGIDTTGMREHSESPKGIFGEEIVTSSQEAYQNYKASFEEKIRQSALSKLEAERQEYCQPAESTEFNRFLWGILMENAESISSPPRFIVDETLNAVLNDGLCNRRINNYLTARTKCRSRGSQKLLRNSGHEGLKSVASCIAVEIRVEFCSTWPEAARLGALILEYNPKPELLDGKLPVSTETFRENIRRRIWRKAAHKLLALAKDAHATSKIALDDQVDHIIALETLNAVYGAF